MKNRIAQLVEIGKIELKVEEVPALKSGDVLVSIRAVGICGSDRHYFLHGGLGSFKQKLPMPMGHEPAGIVVESKSKNFKAGDRVAIEPATHCGSCYGCSLQRENLCGSGTFMGANSAGALADYVVVSDTQLEKIPDSMSFEMAALLEPLGILKHAMNLHRPQGTDAATIFGCGPIGLSMLYLLKKAGLKQVFMIDRLPYRCAFAKSFGATETFALGDPYEKAIKVRTGGIGTQLTIDAAGDDDSIDGCIRVSAPGGHMLFVGIPESDYVRFNPHKMRTKELVIHNVRRSNRTLQDCIKLTAGDGTLEKMISHRFPLESVQKAFEMVGNYSDGVIKCMIVNGAQ